MIIFFNFFGNYIFHKKYSCILVVMCLQYYFTSQKVSCEISFSLRPLGNYYKMKITFSKSKVEYVHYKLKFLHVQGVHKRRTKSKGLSDS